MHADRLACVPEVVTILKLLENTAMVGAKGLLLDGADWPDEWRLEAAERHRALATGCQDDAELVLQVMGVWERTAPDVPPWEPSAERERWARRWWINHEALIACAETRREVLSGLSPAMKEEVKRFVEPALVKRARGAITRAMASLEYRLEGGDIYRAVTGDGEATPTGVLGNAGMVLHAPSRMIPLKRTKLESREHAFLSNIVTLEDWALPPHVTDGEAVTSAASAMDLLVKASREAQPEAKRDILSQLQNVWPAGQRVQLTFEQRGEDASSPARRRDRSTPRRSRARWSLGAMMLTKSRRSSRLTARQPPKTPALSSTRVGPRRSRWSRTKAWRPSTR